MKLCRYRTLRGKIVVKTGLRIGGSAESVEIGGMDNPIIRDPVTEYPYIPGSSIKGKMRSLLELKYDKLNNGGNPHKWCNDTSCFVCRVFGTSAGEEAKIGQGRLIVRDAHLSEESKKRLDALRDRSGLLYAEVKSENTIDRITARANPRTMERVPPGVCFEFELVYRVFDTGDDGKTDEENFKYVLEGLRLIELDALGGSGSRGYGKVEFVELKDEQGNDVTLPDIAAT